MQQPKIRHDADAVKACASGRPDMPDLTYAATVDIRNVEHEITEFMIRRACEEMDAAQQYPFCSRKRANQR